MAVEIKGVITHKLDVKSGTTNAGKQWASQEFVIQQEGQYGKPCVITAFNDKITLIEGLQVGREVKAFVNIEGKEFNSKWYNSINLWKIEAPVNTNTYHTPPPQASVPQSQVVQYSEERDELPF